MAWGKYDNERSRAAFERLLETPGDPGLVEEAVESALPVFDRVMNSRFRSVRTDSEEYTEITSGVPYSLFRYLSRSDSPFYRKYYAAADTHESFLFGWFRNEILVVLRRVRRARERRSEIDMPMTRLSPFNSQASPASIFVSTFVRELPEHMLEKSLEKVRFEGVDRQLCELLIRCRLRSEPTPDHFIRDILKCKRDRLRFFEDYVRVIIRDTLYDLRSVITALPSIAESESDSLYLDLIPGGAELSMHGLGPEHWVK